LARRRSGVAQLEQLALQRLRARPLAHFVEQGGEPLEDLRIVRTVGQESLRDRDRVGEVAREPIGVDDREARLELLGRRLREALAAAARRRSGGRRGSTRTAS
jgi:hypothetical protein